jgi:thioredoxin reductase
MEISMVEVDKVDVLVVGGGPGGLAAALWASRYRRRVMLVDRGEQRNRWTRETHGYLGAEGAPPTRLLEQARTDLGQYREAEVITGVTVDAVTACADGGFDVRLGDGRALNALRLVLATGVRDVFPEITGFADFFGTSIFTCASCDGYEAQGKTVALFGNADELATFAVGLLDWARSVTVIVDSLSTDARQSEVARLVDVGIRVVEGSVAGLTGVHGHLTSIELSFAEAVECELAFCTMDHVQQSPIARELGCDISAEGCVLVDDHCQTSVEHVFAAGDMTPGPHLVQVAASKGAVAGIAAARSLHGENGAPRSSRPAPDSDKVLAGTE